MAMAEQLEDSEMIVHLGPQHPSLPGPFMLDLRLKGEVVQDAYLNMGYIHKGIEKLLENRTYLQCIPITDRMCYLSSLSNNEVFCSCVERMLDVEPPERAQYIRVLMQELSRIQSHLIGMGEFVEFIGFMSMFMFLVRERESIVTLIEMVTGARLTHTYVRFGGVKDDLPDGFAERARRLLPAFEAKMRENVDTLESDEIYLERTEGVGKVMPEVAKQVGLTGPALRASGIEYDIRRIEPTLVYPDLDFKVITHSEGDVFARVHCRFEEIYESLHIIDQCLDQMPSGEVRAKVPKTVKPEGEAYCRLEDPRGEMAMYMIGDGTAKPYRVKVRDPSYANLQALPPVLKGVYMADVVAIAGSMDTCISGVDR
ncbi:MAG: NADH-quinone oxidoreductase subunit D-related protein [Methermicoccaceae archaeon]